MERFIIRFVAALSSRLGRPGSRVVESRLAAVDRRKPRREPRAAVGAATDRGSRMSWLGTPARSGRSLLRPGSRLTTSGQNDPNNKAALGRSHRCSYSQGCGAGARELLAAATTSSRRCSIKPIPFSDPNWTKFKTQPEQWYRDDFLDRRRSSSRMARFDRRETYSSQFRGMALARQPRGTDVELARHRRSEDVQGSYPARRRYGRRHRRRLTSSPTRHSSQSS